MFQRAVLSVLRIQGSLPVSEGKESETLVELHSVESIRKTNTDTFHTILLRNSTYIQLALLGKVNGFYRYAKYTF